MPTHPLTIDPDQQQRLEVVAARQTRSPEFVVRDAIDDYLATHDIEDAVSVSLEEIRDLNEALEHYERTGLHITGEELFAWFDRLRAGERVPPPECHT